MAEHDTDREPKTGGVQEITPLELKERLERGDSLVLVDVREPHEYGVVDLPEELAKLRMPMREVPMRAGELDPDAEIVLYCRSGARSGRVGAFLVGVGYQHVWNLKGGLLKWREDIDPSLRAY